MSDGASSTLAAATLRAEFDNAFARAADATHPAADGFLHVRVGGDGYALRVLEFEEITRAARVVPLPSSDPAFVGLTSLRGAMVPVFSPAVLLGYPSPAVPGSWLARCRHAEGMIAFAFEATEGFTRTAPYSRPFSEGGGAVRPLLRVADLLAEIDTRASSRRKGS